MRQPTSSCCTAPGSSLSPRLSSRELYAQFLREMIIQPGIAKANMGVSREDVTFEDHVSRGPAVGTEATEWGGEELWALGWARSLSPEARCR